MAATVMVKLHYNGLLQQVMYQPWLLSWVHLREAVQTLTAFPKLEASQPFTRPLEPAY